MKWMPTIPTDNLYKFSAISGLWMLIGLFIFYAWMISLSIKLERYNEDSFAKMISKNSLYLLEKRVGSIKNGDLDSNRLDYIPEAWNEDQELRYLSDEIKVLKDKINSYKDYSKDMIKSLDVFSRVDVIIFGITYIFFCASLVVFGFFGWKRNLHDVEKEMRSVSLNIQIKTLEKLELEISDLKNKE